MQKELLLDMVAQNRMTCAVSFSRITPENLSLRLNDQTASIGFIYRHIGETMLMFGYFFGIPPVDAQNTTMGKPDTGQGQDLTVSQAYVERGFAMLEQLVHDTPESSWLDPVDTPFFGTVSKVRLFSHVLFHNASHAGQISLTLARGR